LTASQLQEIISRAIQPLQDELSELRATVASQGEEMAAMKATVTGQGERLTAARDKVVDVEVEQDFIRSDLLKLITHVNQINQKAPAAIGKTSEKRMAEIDKILKAANGSVSFKMLRYKLGIKPNQLSRLIASLDKRKYAVITHPMKPKEKILRVKARWS
jgi:hypothetical protein